LSTTLSDRVYATLRDEITSGDIPPGQRLVRRAVAKRLGVSPLPVIEALARLESDGLVVARPSGGVQLCHVTVDAIQDEVVLREALECQVARMVAVAANDRELDDLAADARALDKLVSRNDPASKIGRQMHMEFHVRLAQLSGSKLLQQHVRSIWLRHLMYVNWINAAMIPPPSDWHQQLVDVFRSRNADAAEQKMREHVRFGFDNLAHAVEQLHK